MISIAEARGKALKYFERNQRQWLAALFERALMPNAQPLLADFAIPLKPPTETEAMADAAQARAWARSWRDGPQSSLVEWASKDWKSVGRQEVPVRLAITSPQKIAEFAQRGREWEKGERRCLALAERWQASWRALGQALQPACLPEALEQGVVAALQKTVLRLSALPERDWEMALLALDWLLQNPGQQVYVRQLPIRGIDSKWLEKHRGAIEPLYAAAAGRPGFGFLRAPHQFRVRFLDAGLTLGGARDVSLSAGELDRLQRLPELAFICENLVSVLAFPEVAGALAIHGGGYAVGLLSDVAWLGRLPVAYWGDLDSNGFAILNQLRHHHPHVRSMMMDAVTLERHRELCVREESPNRGTLDRLTLEEQATLGVLLAGAGEQAGAGGARAGEQAGAGGMGGAGVGGAGAGGAGAGAGGAGALRLEQERIEWDYALTQIAQTAQALRGI